MRTQLQIFLAIFFCQLSVVAVSPSGICPKLHGSVTCKEQITSYECDGGFEDGKDCADGSVECRGGTCKLVLDYDYNTERCEGFPQYCTTGCYSGWSYHSGSCRPLLTPNPPTPTPLLPITRYGCSGTSCVVQSGGPYTVSNCYGSCLPSGPPPPPPDPDMYSCSGPGGSCQISATGTYPDTNVAVHVSP